MSDQSKMFQNIILHLRDGRKITATVPPFCEEGDVIAVERVEVTKALPVSPGLHWSDEMIVAAIQNAPAE